MSDLRKAAEMALDALHNIDQSNNDDAIQVLRQALAQPEWVGLTKDEWHEVTCIPKNATLPMHMLNAIEAKLKEKNA